MSNYIKREDAIKEANTWSMFGNDNLESRLKRLPSADVVEVVRCKYCKYSRVADMDDQEDGYLCSLLHGHEFFSYDYCSYGERREQEHE